ncbi:MAG: shikimate dehydrogenase [Betaproteobacteria bacterium]|nr:MAG: shikimate dehydrogenase [Betaproteobacteria bacterium]
MLDRSVDNYAVVGNPIAQSKSPLIHSAFAEATSQSLSYERIEAPLGQFAQTVDAFRKAGGRGINITAPFKLDAFAYATERSERAQQAGAANALKFEGDRVIAENFDGIGLVRDLVHNLACPINGKRVLIVGAGGATRGALAPLLGESPAKLVVANRTVQTALDVIAPYAAFSGVSACGLNDLGAESFDVVLNASSAGLNGQQTAISANVFAANSFAYDLTYGKGLTSFLQLAKAAGVTRLADGVGMLAEQAAEAFLWWRGVRPDTRAVIERLTVPLVVR